MTEQKDASLESAWVEALISARTFPTSLFIGKDISDKPDRDSASARGWITIESAEQRNIIVANLGLT